MSQCDPTADLFKDILSRSSTNWYDFGVLLGVPTHELNSIWDTCFEDTTTSPAVMLYEFAVKNDLLSWKKIADALQIQGKDLEAIEVYCKYIMPLEQTLPQSTIEERSPALRTSQNNTRQLGLDGTSYIPVVPASPRSNGSLKQVPSVIYHMYLNVKERFNLLSIEVRCAFENSGLSVGEIQDAITQKCDLNPLSGREATLDNVLERMTSLYCFLMLDHLEFFVQSLLNRNESLRRDIGRYKEMVDMFKALVEMNHLMHIVRPNRIEGGIKVSLKLQEFWARITLKKFESAMLKMFKKLYEGSSHISVEEGCIHVSWHLPNTPKGISDFFVPEPDDKDFLSVVGVLSLHVGDGEIYSTKREGCETIEAAMLQATELKNAKAIELLTLLGCNLEVAARSVGISNIISIGDDNETNPSIQHTCVIGRDQDLHRFLNTGDGDLHQSAAEVMKKMLVQEVDYLRSVLTSKGN